jgi:micrococcal nuclease
MSKKFVSKKTQDLFIAVGLLLLGYFFGDTVAKFNNYSPVKIPETVDEVREIDVFNKDKNNDGINKGTGESKDDVNLSNVKFDETKRNWKDMTPATVKYVIDGDTVILTNGEKVRYTSIDTPERGQCWYRQAKEMNRDLVSGKEIILEQDISNRDKYDRLLRYIYVGGKDVGEVVQFVNMELVIAGLARVKEYKPDLEYLEELETAENYARENKIGLWGGCQE